MSHHGLTIRPLLNGGGIVAVIRLFITGPYEWAWSVACYSTYEHLRPWLSHRLITWGTRLKQMP